MNIIDGAEGKLLGTEVIPVDLRVRKVDPGVRIALIELLEIVILEQNDIRKIAVIARLACQRHGVLNIRGTGLGDDLQLEIRIHVILIICLSRFQRRDVKVCVPCVNGKRVLVLRRNISGRSVGVIRKRSHRNHGSCQYSCSQKRNQSFLHSYNLLR